MLKSMTAYGRSRLAIPLGHFSLEIFSVNRRHLDVNSFLPPEFLKFDAELKRWISNAIARGSITVKLSGQFEQDLPIILRPNLAYARQLKEAWDEIAQELSLPSGNGFKLEMLKDVDQIMIQDPQPESEKIVGEVLKELLEKALKELMAMKEIEGLALSEDIDARLKVIEKYLQEIKMLAPNAVKKLQEKLKTRLEEVLPGSVENEERLLREICLYADKVDITEEITRLSSHINQFADLLNAPNVSVGKTLEFLLQEMNREINTIGSKGTELRISQLVILIKNELERIREQVQNVE